MHGKFFAGNATGNSADTGIKLATIPRGGNLIVENPAALAGGTLAERRSQFSTDSVYSLLFLDSAFTDKF